MDNNFLHKFAKEGSFELSIGGDMLALLSALSWVVYGIMLRKWGGKYENFAEFAG